MKWWKFLFSCYTSLLPIKYPEFTTFSGHLWGGRGGVHLCCISIDLEIKTYTIRTMFLSDLSKFFINLIHHLMCAINTELDRELGDSGFISNKWIWKSSLSAPGFSFPIYTMREYSKFSTALGIVINQYVFTGHFSCALLSVESTERNLYRFYSSRKLERMCGWITTCHIEGRWMLLITHWAVSMFQGLY